MTPEEKYVAAAYLVVFVVLLVYVLIMAAKLSRLEREVADLTRLLRERRRNRDQEQKPEEVEVGAVAGEPIAPARASSLRRSSTGGGSRG